jgi:uncharacterized protein (DUF433 family)
MRREIAPRIVVDEAILAGKPVIQGTRVPVEVVIGQLGAGLSIDEVCSEYGLKKEDVLASLSYAAQTLANEEIRLLP